MRTIRMTLRVDEATDMLLESKAKELKSARARLAELYVKDALMRNEAFFITEMAMLAGEIETLRLKLKDGKEITMTDMEQLERRVGKVWLL